MNIRKPTDYNTMYVALDRLIAADLPQVELYFEIGCVVCSRTEKGAAVAASEYLQAAHPKAIGFSPRICAECGSFSAPTRIPQSCSESP